MTDRTPDDWGPPSVILNRANAARASNARLAAVGRRPGLWIGLGVWAVLLVVLTVSLRTTIGSGIVLVVAGLAIGLWVVSRSSLKAITAVYPRDTRVTLRSTPSTLTLETVRGSWQAPWSDFRSVERSRGHLLLYPKGRGGALVLVPQLLRPELEEHLAGAGLAVPDEG